MRGQSNLTDPKVGIAVFFVLCLMALIMMLTIRPKQEPVFKKKYHTQGFDFGSFSRDFILIGGMALPFLIIYLLRFL